MISKSPISDTPTSTYYLSQLDREAEALEREGRTQEAAVLRTTIHSVRVVMDEMKNTASEEDPPLYLRPWARICFPYLLIGPDRT